MSYFTYFNRLKALDSLLRTYYRGTADELANRLGVSRRTIFEYFDILKSHGAEIKYDRYSKSYHYLNAFLFKI